MKDACAERYVHSVGNCSVLFGLRSSSPVPVSFQTVSRPIKLSHSSHSLLTHDTRLGRSIQHLLTLPHGLDCGQAEPGEVLQVSLS
jgi:hypothetical protein